MNCLLKPSFFVLPTVATAKMHICSDVTCRGNVMIINATLFVNYYGDCSAIILDPYGLSCLIPPKKPIEALLQK